MKPALRVRKGGELALSGDVLTDLMRSVLAKGRPFRFRARGSSMSPFIKNGDVVTVSPLGGQELRTGEIVAFVHPESGKAAVHRVVGGQPGLYSLKGDNAAKPDGDLGPDRILGRVTLIERGGKGFRPGRTWRAALIAVLSRSGWLGRSLRIWRHVKAPRAGRSS